MELRGHETNRWAMYYASCVSMYMHPGQKNYNSIPEVLELCAYYADEMIKHTRKRELGEVKWGGLVQQSQEESPSPAT